MAWHHQHHPPPPCPADNDVEALTLELIQLMTLLLKAVPTSMLNRYKKALLHTSWRWVQHISDGSPCKSYAILNMATFFSVFNSPNTIKQIYQVGAQAVLLLTPHDST
jgi:hypothetical protein